MPFTFLLGGARSGKTSTAERIASAANVPVVYLATAEALDTEMDQRIQSHRSKRPDSWATVESPRDLLGPASAVLPESCLVLDCLTLWVSNRLDGSDETILGEAAQVAAFLALRSGPGVVVSNEVGAGIVPADAATRRYRDLLGGVNKIFRGAAKSSYFCIAGGVVLIEDLEL